MSLSLIKYPQVSVDTVPGNPDESVQFNNSGVFGGSSNLLWDNTLRTLTVSGVLNLPLLSTPSGGSTYFVAIGGSPFIHTGKGIDTFSTYIGYEAGLAASTTVSSVQSVVAVGQGAFQNYSSGNFRGSVIGAYSLQNLTSGQNDLAVGWATGLTSVTLGRSTLLGSAAGLNVNGTDNVFIGTSAGGGNANGTLDDGTISANYSILIGCDSGALRSEVDFVNVMFLGTGTNKITNSGTITNTTLVGNYLTTDLSNIAAFGNDDQNIILGVTNPAIDNGAKLQVAGDITTSDPSSGIGKWLLGKVVTASSILDTTKYVEVSIDGVVIKLATVS